MKLLIASLLCLFTFQPISQPLVSDPAPPGPPNPYCITPPTSYPPFECEPDHSLDVDCALACIAAHDACMRISYTHACMSWNRANGQYVTCAKAAIAAYDACMATAQTPEEKAACSNTLITEISRCVEVLNFKRSAIALTIDRDIAACDADYSACMPGCCHPN